MCTDALGDLLSLGAEALELLARRLRVLCELLQACGGLWGATRTPFLQARRPRPAVALVPCSSRSCASVAALAAARCLVAMGPADSFDQFMLHME